MVKACSAPGCRYQYRKGDPVKMHNFPNNAEVRSAWVKAMKKENCPNYPPRGSVICSQHFEKRCYITENGKYSLQRSAIPSIFYDSKSIRPVVFHLLSPTKENDQDVEVENVDPLEADLQEIFGEDDSNTYIAPTQTNSTVIVKSEVIEVEEIPTSDIQIDDETETIEVHEEATNENELELVSYDCTEEELMEMEGNEEVEYYYEIETTEEPEVEKRRKQPHFIGDFVYEDLEDPVQRKKYWLMTHKVYEDQKKKLKYCSARMKLLEKRAEVLTKRLAEANEYKGTRSEPKPSKKIIYAPQKRNFV